MGSEDGWVDACMWVDSGQVGVGLCAALPALKSSGLEFLKSWGRSSLSGAFKAIGKSHSLV